MLSSLKNKEAELHSLDQTGNQHANPPPHITGDGYYFEDTLQNTLHSTDGVVSGLVERTFVKRPTPRPELPAVSGR